MGAAFGLIYVIVIFVIIAKVVKNAGKNGKSIFGSSGQSPAYKAVMDALDKGAAAAGNITNDKIKTTVSSKETPVNRLLDDREHDWLAGQLREERAAKKRMSDMFELKAYHEANCDAEALRRFHASDCDAEGIDAAQGGVI